MNAGIKRWGAVAAAGFILCWAQGVRGDTPESMLTVLESKLLPAGEESSSLFGYSVSVSGDTAVVGAYSEGYGTAYVFIRSGSSWVEQAVLTASDAEPGDAFGYSVAVSGDTALIGAFSDDEGVEFTMGSAYVFVRSGDAWSEQAKLTASDADGGDHFGCSVALDGDTALIGAKDNDDAGSASGCAYVFTRSGTVWSQRSKLTALDAAALDEFGKSVSLDGNTALVGAPYNDDGASAAGSAYVFVGSGSSWSQQAKLTAGGNAVYDARFGYSVSIDDNTALAGAYYAGNGSVYVFVRSGSSWSEEEILTASDGAGFDLFGTSVALDGDTALVGAVLDDDKGSASGSAYVFTRDGSVWSERAKLRAPDGARDDHFGAAASLDGGTALVGAYDDDGTASDGSSIYNLGSCYMFSLYDIGIDTDGDGGSDAFETANGFSYTNSTDLATLDSDSDGIIDLFEIFQGTEKGLPDSREGLKAKGELSGAQTFVARYRRSTDPHGIVAFPSWSVNLVNWNASGIRAQGLQVNLAESVVETGADYETVELTASVASGTTDVMFLQLELMPTQ